mmetsp:Transcript_49240/g.159595  ORF Transcript_49240/g.159595 Transcript_49240/m.159595 type:complete len:148 (-) Transcript_49240:125-568(-)
MRGHAPLLLYNPGATRRLASRAAPPGAFRSRSQADQQAELLTGLGSLAGRVERLEAELAAPRRHAEAQRLHEAQRAEAWAKHSAETNAIIGGGCQCACYAGREERPRPMHDRRRARCLHSDNKSASAHWGDASPLPPGAPRALGLHT